MSVQLREDLIAEIEDKVRNRKGTYPFGELFNKGEYRINKVHFDRAIVLAIQTRDKKLLDELEVIADPNNLVAWPMFKSHMKKWIDDKNNSGRNKSWKKDGKSQSDDDTITWKYRRKTPSEGGAPLNKPTNMEASFDRAIKAGVRKFFQTITDKNLIYSHGKSLPGAFGTQKGELGQMGTASGGTSNPGAKGTVAEGAIVLSTLKILSASAGRIAKQKGLYDSLIRVVDAKIQDLFGSTSKVKKKRSRKEIKDSLEYSGELIIDQRLNPGQPDQAIVEEMKRFLRLEQDDFVTEVQKMVKMNAQSIKNLWSGSTNTVDALILIGRGDLITKLGRINKKKAKVGKHGGLDMRFKENKNLISQMEKAIRDKASGTGKTKAAGKHKVKKSTVAKAGIAGGRYRSKAKSRVDQVVGNNPLALATLINKALPAVIASKMTSPALNYRTGRFSRSAEVKNISVGPRGGTAVEYTYMKDPYQTFEPGFAMGSTQRDPRKIIGESIREIAQGIVGNKFLTTRRV